VPGRLPGPLRLGTRSYSHSLDRRTQLLQTGLVESHLILRLWLKEECQDDVEKRATMDTPLATGYDDGGYLLARLSGRGAGISRGRRVGTRAEGGKRGPVIAFHGH
jgi:hypothetical protein